MVRAAAGTFRQKWRKVRTLTLTFAALVLNPLNFEQVPVLGIRGFRYPQGVPAQRRKERQKAEAGGGAAASASWNAHDLLRR